MEYRIPNNLTEIYDLEAKILGDVERTGYDENSRFAIRLALDEALVNAHKHGNREDPQKQLLVQVEITDERVEIAVEDEGTGFDQSHLLDPRKGDRLGRLNGRGIFLIRQFMSSAHFNKAGNRITFTYHKRDDLEIVPQGLTHWRLESADVLELDPIRIDRNATVILESVTGLLDAGAGEIILDLKFLERVDSAILGFLVGATREAEMRGAPLVLVRPQPDIERLIRATCLDVVLKVFADLKQGLEEVETLRKKQARGGQPLS